MESPMSIGSKPEIKAADKKKALDSALAQIEKTFGKGSIMKLTGQDQMEITGPRYCTRRRRHSQGPDY
jgi:hypothetical protein